MFKKSVAILCAAVLAFGALGGCSKTDTDNEERTLTVQVQSIDGNMVTALVGSLEQQARGAQGDMELPADMPAQGDVELPADMPLPDGDMALPDGWDDFVPDEQGDLPAGGGRGSLPDGGMPNDAMGGRSGFAAGEESIVFEITSDTTILVDSMQGSQAGSAASIVVGGVLTLTLDANNNALH